MEAFGVDQKVFPEVVARGYDVAASESAVVLYLHTSLYHHEQSAVLQPVELHIVEAEFMFPQQVAPPRALPSAPHQLVVLAQCFRS
jgi:hypothetical protein